MSESYEPTQAEYDTACGRVGHFLNSWAFLERTLNDGIAKVLGLESLEGLIATANMQVRDKIHIFKTLINLRGVPKEWCEKALATAEAISAMSKKRNTVAHVPFGPHPKGGVEFLPIKAKGALTFPDMIWPAKDFNRYSDEMDALADQVKKIADTLHNTKVILKAHAELTSGKPPSPETQNFLLRLLQGSPDSQPANSEASSETPPLPRGA